MPKYIQPRGRLLAGAKQAGGDFGIKVSTFGPTSETNIDQQVQLVENSISRGAQGIVIAANSSGALNSAIDRARKAGIKVITVDTRVTTASEAFVGTDNLKAGSRAGQRMCDLLKARDKTSGSVMIESSVAGIQSLADRDAGFRQGLAAACPDVTASAERYNNNDINTAASQVNDALTSNSALLGVFADNNTSGVGAARAIKDNQLAGKVAVVAFDSDAQENAALAAGTIDALVVQNPYFFGYQGVVLAGMAIVNRIPPRDIDPGAVVSHMRDRYGILIGTGLDKIRTTTLRVGHMGITSSPRYVLPTLSAIEMTLRDLGYRSEAGAGVSAAQAVFSGPPA